MSYSGFEKDLYEIYKSEVTGEALFQLAAKLSFNADHKHKWQVLAQLETQTKERYLDYTQKAGQSPKYPTGARLGGSIFGFLFGLMPWATAMKMLASGTPPLIKVFSRLSENAGTDDKAFFEYVLAHEQAIDRFAELEIAGDSANSLKPVLDLLS